MMTPVTMDPTDEALMEAAAEAEAAEQQAANEAVAEFEEAGATVEELPADVAAVPAAEDTHEVTPEPKKPAETPVGSVGPVAGDVPDVTVWHQIQDARAEEREAEEEVDSLSEELKDAKKRLEKASEKLGKLIDEAKYPTLFSGTKTAAKPTTGETPIPEAANPPKVKPALVWEHDTEENSWYAENTAGLIDSYLLENDKPVLRAFYIDVCNDGYEVIAGAGELIDSTNGPIKFGALEEAQAFCEARDAELWAKANGCSKTGEIIPNPSSPAEDDSWKSLTLAELGITKPSIVKILTEREPPLTTAGALQAYMNEKGQWWAKDLKGIGPKYQEEIEKAFDMLWVRRASEAKATGVPQDEKATETPADQAKTPEKAIGVPQGDAAPPEAPKSVTLAELGVNPHEFKTQHFYPGLLNSIQVGKGEARINHEPFEYQGREYVAVPPPGGSKSLYVLRRLHRGVVDGGGDPDPFVGNRVFLKKLKPATHMTWWIGPREESIDVKG